MQTAPRLTDSRNAGLCREKGRLLAQRNEMKKLLKYLKQYKKEAVLAPLFKMLEASFELFVPLVMAKIIDTGIREQDLAYILKMGAVLVLLGVIPDCTVFRGQGCSRLRNRGEKRSLPPYQSALLHRAGYPGDSHADHQDDQ